MTETRLSCFGVLTIEHEATQDKNFEDVIFDFPSVKAKKKEILGVFT